MFSGIVEETGTVKSLDAGSLSIQADVIFSDLKPGDSVAVNGVCLTARDIGGGVFTVDVMPETLRRTNLGDLRPGVRVNLERAMTLSSRMGGHLVQGHIDATGLVKNIRREGDAQLMTIAAPPELIRYVVEKGFIAVDGLSLTAFDVTTETFTVSLVTFTRDTTTIATRRPGDRVNLEADIIAKYTERFTARREGRITSDFLAEHGFTS
ncbi:riboflavin synthase, alpha subunit [Dehalogenimonas lykanthroporepellens BL-DC-9]|nr:riboflavin synthase, alpha subunit [Dehalogenimonas lykanthroporepellens BL-DC-9]